MVKFGVVFCFHFLEKMCAAPRGNAGGIFTSSGTLTWCFADLDAYRIADLIADTSAAADVQSFLLTHRGAFSGDRIDDLA